jgi:integral membrane sensor domain MASE1
MASLFSTVLKYFVEFLGVAITYLAAAKLSLALASVHPSATPIWPPTGFALAAVLLLGYRIWPAISVAALIANATTAGSIFTSVAIATGNTLESVVGAYLINRWSNGVRTFDTPAGVARFALICFMPSTMISATLGVVSLSLGGYADWANFASIWMTWWMGDLAGALVITPVIVLWTTSFPRSPARQEWMQSCAVFSAVTVVGLIAFSPMIEQTANRGPLAFLAILPLMWAALRRNQRDTATNLLAVVQSMARQVARQTDNFQDFDKAFSTRLRAFADTHDLLVTRGWHRQVFATLFERSSYHLANRLKIALHLKGQISH